MSETTPETSMPEPEAPQEDDGFEPITSRDDLDRIIGERTARYQRKLNELKPKADKFDEIEQASKTQQQKDAERIAALESELATERQSTLRADVARDKGVPAHRITGTTKEEFEESADAYLAEIADLAPKQQKRSTSLKSGASSSDSRMDPQERAAAALRAFRQT